MSAEELLAVVRREDRLGLGATLADELSLHLPPSESVHARLRLEHGPARSYGFAISDSDARAETWLILTERHLVRAHTSQALHADGRPTIEVGSSPLGRLRGVKTRRDPDDRWHLVLDLAGPTFGDEEVEPIRFWGEGDGPSPEARAFLAALATVRR
ncbi:MAG: hypothetical protein EP329_18630 [Deltaproteobacteria bacterium]|nr:MAG: hypothetical protein EP329_18630 [Deltaproteobacteria bacterium]